MYLKRNVCTQFKEEPTKENSFAHFLYERDTGDTGEKYGFPVNRARRCTVEEIRLDDAVPSTSAIQHQELIIDDVYLVLFIHIYIFALLFIYKSCIFVIINICVII